MVVLLNWVLCSVGAQKIVKSFATNEQAVSINNHLRTVTLVLCFPFSSYIARGSIIIMSVK